MSNQRCARRQGGVCGISVVRGAVLLAGLSSAAGWPLGHGGSLYAEPVANMVRPAQDAVLEQILSDLEAKAITGRGVWQLTRARQDQPATHWLMGQGEETWYLKCTDAVPSALTLVGQGRDVYSLTDSRRFPLSSLRGIEPGEYQLSHWLLQLNLRPRQMVGLLGDLRNLGQVTMNGVTYIHLQAARDEVATAQSLPSSPSVDLYYDPQHHAIARASVHASSGVGDEVAVMQWGQLGTNGDWPTRMTGQRYVRSGQGQANIGAPLVTTVAKFAPGRDPELERLSQQVAQTSFFVTARANLHSAEVYEQQLAQHPENISDRLALASVRFQSRNITEGLKQWQTAEQKLSLAERQRLAEAISPYAAEAAWFTSSDKTHAEACLPLLEKLEQSLPDIAWRQSSVQILWAWQALHRDAMMSRRMEAIEKPLLSRLVRGGQVAALQAMLLQMDKYPDDAALLKPHFQQVEQMPLAAGYVHSQASTLVAAYVATGKSDRAIAFLRSLDRDPRTAQADQALLGQITKAIGAGLKFRAGQRDEFTTMIQQYAQLDTLAKAQDPSTLATRNWLVSLGAEWLGESEESSREPCVQAAGEQLRRSAKETGAKDYWSQLIWQVVRSPWPNRNHELFVRQVMPLAKVYGQTFQNPSYESQLWLRLARFRGGLPDSPTSVTATLRYLDQALATAVDDAGRMAVLRQLVAAYLQGKDAGRAAQIIQGVGGGLQDPNAKDEAAKLLLSVKNQIEREQQQATIEQKQVDLNRAKGRITALQQELVAAKRQGRSAQDMASLEQTVQTLREAASIAQ